MFTLYYSVRGASRVSEREYETLEDARARGLRWSQSPRWGRNTCADRSATPRRYQGPGGSEERDRQDSRGGL